MVKPSSSESLCGRWPHKNGLGNLNTGTSGHDRSSTADIPHGRRINAPRDWKPRYEHRNRYEMPHAQPPLLWVKSSGWRPIGRQSIFMRSNQLYHRSPRLDAISHAQLGRSGSASSSRMSACDAVDGSHRRHLGATDRCRWLGGERPLLAEAVEEVTRIRNLETMVQCRG